MKIKIQHRLYGGFIAAIFLVIVVAIISISTFRREYQEAELVKHSYQVLNSLESLQKILIDMETGRRGFRSTNDKKFLEPYYNALRVIQPEINNFLSLIGNDVQKRRQAAEVIEEINGLLNFWHTLGEDASKYDRARIVEIMTEEKIKMDRVRQNISSILEDQNEDLVNTENENNRFIKQATTELFVSIALILAVVLLLIVQILREFKNRQKAETGLLKNFKEMAQLNQENSERNWLLTGLNKVNEVLQGHANESSLSQQVLNTIIDYLNARAGALYIFNEEEHHLELKASYALPNAAKKVYQLHEGFVGQAATEKEPVVIADIPPGYASVEGGVAQVEPVHAIYVSLFYQNEVKGIIELLSFKAVERQALNLLKLTSNNISAALHSVQAREKVMLLFDRVQVQKEELEKQQEELRQTNEELVVQAEVLQTSEEEMKVQEEELRQINSELAKKNQALELARQDLSAKARELEESGRYKSEFLANMSHELRTPLNSVLILAKLLADNKEKNLTEKQVAHAKIINKSGSDLLQLINDILDLSKIEAGKVDLYLDDVSLKALCNDMEQLFSVIAEEKGVHYAINLQKGVDKIQTDKQKVEQILKNLLSNAFKFTASGGRVELNVAQTVYEKQPHVAISVKDCGIGIPEDKQQLIFEAFQQAEGSTNRRYGGTGLGLSITKELLKLLKGKIQVESKEKEGSTFTIYLPLEHAASAANYERLLAEPNSSVEEQKRLPDDRYVLNKKDRVLLIIEDDEIFARIIKNFAENHGYKTIVALSGEEGLHCAKTYAPSAIILDLQLPGIKGTTLLKQFKTDQFLKHIPVYIISADDEWQSETFAGALAFLKKPIEKADLEKAFLLIGEYLQSAIKRVMIISQNSLKEEILKKIIGERNYDVVCDSATEVQQVIERAQLVKFDCIIAEIGSNIAAGIQQLKQLRLQQHTQHIPLIICLDQDIVAADELELKRIADVVVRESSLSSNRLLDELELFLYRVEGDRKKSPVKYHVTDMGDHALEHKKVLLVDDDMRNIFALSAALEQEKMQVFTASDGKEALAELQRLKQVDIVLMDVMMPEMDGYETIEKIRNDLKMTRLPVIALTAKAMAGDKEKCMKAGASDYITKPVDMQKLIALMKVWVS